MKPLVLLFLLFQGLNGLFAQSSSSFSKGPNLNYSIESQKASMPWWILNLDLVQIDMGLKNIDGASFNIGLRGYVAPIENLGLDYKYQRSWLTASFQGFNADFELGVHYLLQDKTKIKDTKILLDYNIEKNYDGPKTTETISSKSIRIPAERRIIRGIRAGMISKRGPYNIEDIEGIISAEASLSSSGFYFGLLQKTLSNVFVNVDGWGRQFNSIGRDLAIDLLIFPNQNISIAQLEGTALSAAQIEERLDAGSLGWRFVYDLYQIEKNSKTGKNFGSTFRFECGSKPYQGFYFGGSWGMTLIKGQKRPF